MNYGGCMRPEGKSPTSGDGHVTALLVDGDADTRQMYGMYLSHRGVAIEETGDGREALALALARPHDVVITETRLPGLSGFDLCQLLRRDEATAATPIIVITADVFPEMLERAQRAGADAVLSKPCLPDFLFNEIERQIHRAIRLMDHARELHARALRGLQHSQALVDQARTVARQRVASRRFARSTTTSPPTPPAELVCPACDARLVYRQSYVGGVSVRHLEQWDLYDCGRGCGVFEYRQRTRRLRQIAASDQA
jgi:twitching motility two-component system response regulator PilG